MIELMFGTSERVLELLAERERLDAALLAAVGALDASGEWAADGTASTYAWLVHHGRLTGPEASRLLRSGRLVHGHERTARRLQDADVTCAQVDALARAVRGTRHCSTTTRRRCSTSRPPRRPSSSAR